MMQRMSKARSYLSLAREWKLELFSKQISSLTWRFWPFSCYIVTSLTSRDVVPVKSRRNFVERQIYARWQTNTFRLPSVLYMYWGFNPCVWVYLLAVWFLSCTQNLLGFSRCAGFHPCNLTSDISVQNFVDKAISPSNLRWLVPVSLFLDSFNFKRSMQKSKPKASQHFSRVGLYKFVISSYHGNGLFGPTFKFPALITRKLSRWPYFFWTTAFGIKNGKCSVVLKKILRSRIFAKVKSRTFVFTNFP